MTEPEVIYGPHRTWTIRGRYPLGDVVEDGSLTTGPMVDRTWIAESAAEVAEVLHDIANDLPQIFWSLTVLKLHEVAARWGGGTRTADDTQWLQRIGVTITSELKATIGYGELKDSLDGLSAYDVGAVDSGIHDDTLRRRIIDYLNSLSSTERLALLNRVTTDLFLSPEAKAQGYSTEDAAEFLSWCKDIGVL